MESAGADGLLRQIRANIRRIVAVVVVVPAGLHTLALSTLYYIVAKSDPMGAQGVLNIYFLSLILVGAAAIWQIQVLPGILDEALGKSLLIRLAVPRYLPANCPAVDCESCRLSTGCEVREAREEARTWLEV